MREHLHQAFAGSAAHIWGRDHGHRSERRTWLLARRVVQEGRLGMECELLLTRKHGHGVEMGICILRVWGWPLRASLSLDCGRMVVLH